MMDFRVTAIRRKWREGKVRPVPGNSPHDRQVRRGYFFTLKESLRRSLRRHSVPLHAILRPSVCVFQAWRNLSGPMGLAKPNQTLGRDQTASRRSAPSPGKRTRREEHAPSHRPQMSSGRLFLDRVGRHQWDTRRGRLDKEERNKVWAVINGGILVGPASAAKTAGSMVP
jgi:hypothetical protein